MTTAAENDQLLSQEFIQLLNRESHVKVLDVFLGKGAKPLTSSQLEEFTGFTQSTVSRATTQLADAGIINTSDESRSREYWLNDAHPAADGLKEAHFQLHIHADAIQDASPDYDPEDNHYHTGSPFVELFRYPTNIKLVAAFLAYPDAHFTGNKVAQVADVDPKTVYSNIELLCRIGIIKEANYPDNSTHYTLNQDHPASTGFLTAYDDLTSRPENDIQSTSAEHTTGESTPDEVVDHRELQTATENLDEANTATDASRPDINPDDTRSRVSELLQTLASTTSADEDNAASRPATHEFKNRYDGTRQARRTDASTTASGCSVAV